MDITSLMILIGGIGVWFLGHWLDKRNEEKRAEKSKEWRKAQLSQLSVAKEQARFEKHLTDYPFLPDAIRHKAAYIYWNLMRGWFEELLARNYGIETVCTQIRADLLSYISLLEGHATYRFLSSGADSEKKADEYSEQAWNAYTSLQSLETTVARAVGTDAVKILESVRPREISAFDQTGRKPIAPNGFHYSYSFKDPDGDQLVPDRNHARESVSDANVECLLRL